MTTEFRRKASADATLAYVGAAYLLLTLIDVYLSRQLGGRYTLLFAHALGMAWLLRAPSKQAPAFLLFAAGASLGVEAVLGQPDWRGYGAIAVGLLEMQLGAVLLRRHVEAAPFAPSLPALARLFMLGCVIPPLLAVAVGAALGPVGGGFFYQGGRSTRYLAEVIGAAAMLPLAMSMLYGAPRAVAERAGLAFAGAMLFLFATCFVALNFLSFPVVVIQMPLLLIALRMGFMQTAALVWLTVLLVETLLATGMLIPPSVFLLWRGADLYMPLFAILAPPLLLAASTAGHRRSESGRQDAELALARNHERLQSIIDHMPAMIGYWDRSLRNGFGNRAYLEWFGLTPVQMLGKHIREVIGEQRYALNLPYIKQALAGETPMFERVITDASGVTRDCLASYVPDIADGQVQGFYAFVTDISQLKRAQRN